MRVTTGGRGLQLGRLRRLRLRRLDDLDRGVHLAGALFALLDFEGEAELHAKLARDFFLQAWPALVKMFISIR